MSYHLGDVVKVRSVPDGCLTAWATMLGHVGIVLALDDDANRAAVQSITIEGRAGLLAFIDVKALEPVDDPVWLTAAATYQRRYDRELQEWKHQKWLALETLSARYLLSIAQLIEIADAVTAAPGPMRGEGDQ